MVNISSPAVRILPANNEEQKNEEEKKEEENKDEDIDI